MNKIKKAIAMDNKSGYVSFRNKTIGYVSVMDIATEFKKSFFLDSVLDDKTDTLIGRFCNGYNAKYAKISTDFLNARLLIENIIFNADYTGDKKTSELIIEKITLEVLNGLRKLWTE